MSEPNEARLSTLAADLVASGHCDTEARAREALSAAIKSEPVAIIRTSPEHLARIDARDDVPQGLADLVATCGVEVVEASADEWAPIQAKLDAEATAHDLEHQAEAARLRAHRGAK